MKNHEVIINGPNCQLIFFLSLWFFITHQQCLYSLLLSPYFLGVDGVGVFKLFDVQKFLELTAVVFTDYVISTANEFTFHKNTGNLKNSGKFLIINYNVYQVRLIWLIWLILLFDFKKRKELFKKKEKNWTYRFN